MWIVLSSSAIMFVLSAEGGNGWSHYGGSLKGDRYVSRSSITAKNAKHLVNAWIYRTGDVSDGYGFEGNPSNFKATPIFIQGKLIFSTGFNRVIALNPATGKELWAFDPNVDFSKSYSEMFTSRGVAVWVDSNEDSVECRVRVFAGTLDARLIALDAFTGEFCPSFGKEGQIDLSVGIRRYRKWDYSLTSPPTVVGDLVIVGSAIGDNGAAHLEPGLIRAFNVRNGSLAWLWDPIPRAERHPGSTSWTNVLQNHTGGANVWSVMSADTERDLIFLPTTSPSPDFYGGVRLGDNAFANSVVALQASTGRFVWGYQTIHHDLWDYDLASQPLLFEHVASDGTERPAVAQASKTGFVFVLDRETGEPLHPVEERIVPQTDVPGEQTSKTQPFPKLRLHTTDAQPLPIWDFTPEHLKGCERLLEGIRYEGIFTPPSLEGTLLFPGNPGGTNWGSIAYDEVKRIGYLIVNRLPTVVKLIPRREFTQADRIGTLNGARAQHTEQDGTPYGMARFDLFFDDLPCLQGPWTTLVAVDLERGEVKWESAIGSITWRDVGTEAEQWGFYVFGGPMVTQGGVVFFATPNDKKLYAFDGTDGTELWARDLPAGAHATPMGYRFGDADYVVIAAGGELADGSGRGDYVIAFRLAIDAEH
ncbi:MAG: pyrroloquinoline quinone-dependent dehydrogenase [Gammaproteobacteria bacterium]|nr:pyrroloquinoline quinone-dependent dehydrogenase [Gammaproteobacteria bacterium]